MDINSNRKNKFFTFQVTGIHALILRNNTVKAKDIGGQHLHFIRFKSDLLQSSVLRDSGPCPVNAVPQ